MCLNGKCMKHLLTAFSAALLGALLIAAPARAQGYMCEDQFHFEDQDLECYRTGPTVPDTPPPPPTPPAPDPLRIRVANYARTALNHRLTGLASYYSTSLN